MEAGLKQIVSEINFSLRWGQKKVTPPSLSMDPLTAQRPISVSLSKASKGSPDHPSPKWCLI
jgi:hypothetical protein